MGGFKLSNNIFIASENKLSDQEGTMWYKKQIIINCSLNQLSFHVYKPYGTYQARCGSP